MVVDISIACVLTDSDDTVAVFMPPETLLLPHANPRIETDLRIVYDEVTHLLDRQSDAVDLLYNKLNWVLVSDVVFLDAVLTGHGSRIFIALLVCLSAIFALIGFRAVPFKVTAKISRLLEIVGEEAFLRSLIKKKISAFHKNKKRARLVVFCIRASIGLLILAIFSQGVDIYLFAV